MLQNMFRYGARGDRDGRAGVARTGSGEHDPRARESEGWRLLHQMSIGEAGAPCRRAAATAASATVDRWPACRAERTAPPPSHPLGHRATDVSNSADFDACRRRSSRWRGGHRPFWSPDGRKYDLELGRYEMRRVTGGQGQGTPRVAGVRKPSTRRWTISAARDRPPVPGSASARYVFSTP